MAGRCIFKFKIHTCIALKAAELHFPADKEQLTGRRQAALQNADRVVRLGSLTAVGDDLPSLFSAGSLEQLAAFRRLAELELSGRFPVSADDISLLPRSLRRLTLCLQYR